MATPDEIAEELYGTDPDLFVTARSAAVAAAKAAGDKSLATAVGALRKPTRSAWLVNLLARSYAGQLGALAELAGRLADATARVDVGALRSLGTERAALVADLSRKAVELGRAAGYDGGDAVRAEVATTLQAALADPDVLEPVLRGRLDKAQVYAGFGFPLALDVPVAARVSAPPTPVTESDPVEDLELARAHAEVQRLTTQLDAEETAIGSAEEAVAAANSVLDRASQEVADLRSELKAAEAAELAAREASRVASEELHDARTAEQQTRVALERAKQSLTVR